MSSIYKMLFIYLFLLTVIYNADEVTNDINTTKPSTTELTVVGRSSLSVWFFDVYDITLKAPNGKYIAGEYPLNIELTYKRDITGEQLVSETLKQWQRFDLEGKKIEHWAELLSNLWPDVKPNDSISFYIDQHKTTFFYFNANFIGEINQDGFADAFASIWLDKNGPYPKMTKELIGQKKS